jgi:hypothetical protein
MMAVLPKEVVIPKMRLMTASGLQPKLLGVDIITGVAL